MYYNVQQCYICKKETGHYNGKCGNCEAEHKAYERKCYFDRKMSMTLEQRIREIEEYLYNENISPSWKESTDY